MVVMGSQELGTCNVDGTWLLETHRYRNMEKDNFFYITAKYLYFHIKDFLKMLKYVVSI